MWHRSNIFCPLFSWNSRREFILYDAQGKCILTSSNQSLTNGIDVSLLNNGIYYYTIIDRNNGVVKSGKWFKK